VSEVVDFTREARVSGQPTAPKTALHEGTGQARRFVWLDYTSDATHKRHRVRGRFHFESDRNGFLYSGFKVESFFKGKDEFYIFLNGQFRTNCAMAH